MTESHPEDAAAHPSDGGPSPEQTTRKTRTRTGCLNCRRRRRKCDERRPECQGCRQRDEACEWGMKITFKQDNANSLAAEHPSMQEASRKRPRRFEILDVTSQIEKDYNIDGPVLISNDEPQSLNNPTAPPAKVPRRISIHSMVRSQTQGSPGDDQRSPWPSEYGTPTSITTSQSDYATKTIGYPVGHEYPTRRDFDASSGSLHAPYSSNPRIIDGFTPESLTSSNRAPELPSPGSSLVHTEDAAADLLALRYLPAQTPQTQPLFESPVSGGEDIVFGIDHIDPPPIPENHLIDPQMFDTRDGIFLPGSAYQELHSTLRDHLIFTARSAAPTRAGTPDLQDLARASRQATDLSDGKADSDPDSTKSSKPTEILPQREYILWKTWIDEVAPWLDKFDNKRHFELKIPMMAKTIPHLKFSVLALCARQIEQKENSPSSSESLSLYQEAIHLLLPELQSKDTAIITSCVILCVLEMLSCSPKEWRRHLEGCAHLLQAVGINGFSGGLEQALFWCFARMDLCGALISQDSPLIPVTAWASNIDLKSDIRLFRSNMKGFDMQANFAVFLCARSTQFVHEHRNRDKLQGPGRDWCMEWNLLMSHFDNWYTERSEEMKPLLAMPASGTMDESPFPIVLFGNGSAVSGNQLYHTGMLLMLQEKPSGLVMAQKQKSILWHARRICAISLSNNHHGAWTNSIQPLWVAGKIMSHPSEHRAIVNILQKIEKETGWLTGWRVEDLKSWWGDLDE